MHAREVWPFLPLLSLQPTTPYDMGGTPHDFSHATPRDSHYRSPGAALYPSATPSYGGHTPGLSTATPLPCVVPAFVEGAWEFRHSKCVACALRFVYFLQPWGRRCSLCTRECA